MPTGGWPGFRLKQVWIPLEVDVLGHPKTVALGDALGVDSDRAFLHLLRFWFWCTNHARGPDGFLIAVPVGAIAKAAEWSGEAQAFYDALLTVGFLDELPDGRICVHGWEEHFGKLAALKDRNRRDVAEHRLYQRLQGQMSLDGILTEPDVSLTSGLRPDEVSRVPPVNKSSHGHGHGHGEQTTSMAPSQATVQPAPRGKVKPVRHTLYSEQYTALCEVFGADPSMKNPLQRQKFNVAAAALGKDGVTGDQIRRFPAAWRRLYPDTNVRPSPTAFAYHQSELLNGGAIHEPERELPPPLTGEERAENEAAREAERQEREASGMPRSPSEFEAYFEAQRRGETWVRDSHGLTAPGS